MRNTFLTVLLVAGTAPYNSATAAPSAEILEFGYYEVLKEGERIEDRSTTSGIIQAGPTVKLLRQTDVIPITPGRLFGFRFRLKGFAGGDTIEIREVVTHPRMIRAEQKVSTGFETQLSLTLKQGEFSDYAGYSLNNDYEMVAGDWRFEFWYGDKKLLEQKFTTVKR